MHMKAMARQYMLLATFRLVPCQQEAAQSLRRRTRTRRDSGVTPRRRGGRGGPAARARAALPARLTRTQSRAVTCRPGSWPRGNYTGGRSHRPAEARVGEPKARLSGDRDSEGRRTSGVRRQSRSHGRQHHRAALAGPGPPAGAPAPAVIHGPALLATGAVQPRAAAAAARLPVRRSCVTVTVLGPPLRSRPPRRRQPG